MPLRRGPHAQSSCSAVGHRRRSSSLSSGSQWGHDSTQRPPSNPCLTQVSNAHLPFNDEENENMDTLLTFATDERAARIALIVITDPADATTGRLLAVHGAVSTVMMLADDAPVPGLDNVEAQLWRKRLLPRVEPRLIQEALDRKSTRLNSSHVAISYAVF